MFYVCLSSSRSQWQYEKSAAPGASLRNIVCIMRCPPPPLPAFCIYCARDCNTHSHRRRTASTICSRCVLEKATGNSRIRQTPLSAQCKKNGTEMKETHTPASLSLSFSLCSPVRKTCEFNLLLK